MASFRLYRSSSTNAHKANDTLPIQTVPCTLPTSPRNLYHVHSLQDMQPYWPSGPRAFSSASSVRMLVLMWMPAGERYGCSEFIFFDEQWGGLCVLWNPLV